MSTTVGFAGDEIAPFFGFMGAAAALVFSCTLASLDPLICLRVVGSLG